MFVVNWFKEQRERSSPSRSREVVLYEPRAEVTRRVTSIVNPAAATVFKVSLRPAKQGVQLSGLQFPGIALPLNIFSFAEVAPRVGDTGT